MVDPETIYHWYRLDDRITTSGQPTETELADIAALGVRCVINLGLHSHEKELRDEAATVHALAMTYVHIPSISRIRPSATSMRSARRSTRRVTVRCMCTASPITACRPSSIATAAPSSAWMRHERELIWIGSGNLTLFGQHSSTERPLSDGAFPSALKRRPICPMAKILQAMWKVGPCGFRCRAWRGSIQHDTHFWSRSLADVFVARVRR